MREVPKFDISNHPGIDDFKKQIYTGPDTEVNLLPVLITREEQALKLETQVRSLPIPEYARDPRLDIHDDDQGLRFTPFDDIEGMDIQIPPKEYIESWRVQHEYNLRLANHPARLASIKAVEERGFQPPEPANDNNIIEESLAKRIILQLSDMGQNIDISALDHTRIQELYESRDQDELDEFVSEEETAKQIHRTEQFAMGIYVMQGHQARNFIGGAAMPDINGSDLSLGTQIMMHGRGDVPEGGPFGEIPRGVALGKATREYVINHPLYEELPEEWRQFAIDHALGNLFAAVEVAPEKAIRRALAFAKEGITKYRVYGHTQGGDVIEATRLLKKEIPGCEIHASQITDINILLALQEVGADAGITGVGSGGRCTTADQAQLIPTNAIFAILARKYGVTIPLIAEGGAVDELINAALTGYSGVNASGSVAGGTFEAPGGRYFAHKKGRFYKPYGGEASPRTKWLSGRTFQTGLPYFPEGEQTFKELDPLRSSIAQRHAELLQRFILGPVTLRIEPTPFIIEEMQSIRPIPLYQKSATTFELQKTH